jgi:hypothetical protein
MTPLKVVYFLISLICLSGMVDAGEPVSRISFIDPDLVSAMNRGDSVSFFIEFRDQADTFGAKLVSTKEEKGRYVYTILTEHARRTQADLIRLLETEKVHYKSFWISNVIQVEGDMQLFGMLLSRNDIAALYLNRFEKKLPDPLESAIRDSPEGRGAEWNLYQIRAVDVWTAFDITGRGIVVMNNDTGVEWTHWALKDNYRGWSGASADHNYNWYDATGAYPLEPVDVDGHGTHTTGTKVGHDGMANQIGVAPGAKWIAFKCMDDFGYGEDSWVLESFQWALAPTLTDGSNPDPSKAPHVISNSWGDRSTTYPYLETPVQNCVNAGIFVAFSGGNTGSNCGTTKVNCSSYENVCAVGAVKAGGQIADFSSRGPSALDPSVTKPNVVAPGKDIRSSLPGNSYGLNDGTSMACPHVAGLVALLWEANPDFIGDVDYTRWIIRNTAVATYDDQCGSGYKPNNVYGSGQIDCIQAVCAVLGNIPTPSPLPTPPPTPTPVGTNTPTPVPPQTRYVPSEYATIQAAINVANTGDLILVDDGIYTGTGNVNIDVKGKLITIRSENGPENCIIDGENVSGRCGFLVTKGETEETVIHGFTIRNMNKQGSHAGGIRVSSDSSPVISKCVFTGNAAGFGGAVYVGYGSNALITDCIFYNNSAPDGGSGIHVSYSQAHIHNCLFYSNYGTAVVVGGTEQTSATLVNCTIANNYRGMKGAGPNISIINSIIYHNTIQNLTEQGCTIDVMYSNISNDGDVWPGVGNIDEDPLFVIGSKGDYYLSLWPSACINAGNDAATAVCFSNGLETLCMSNLTTRTDSVLDTGTVDMGYHYDVIGLPTPTPTNTPTNTPTDTPTPTPKTVWVPSQYATIADAIADCQEDDTIIVEDGIYSGPGFQDISFFGRRLRLKSENGPAHCIIDVIPPGRAFHFSHGESNLAVLEGFTIRNAETTGYGGGILVEHSSPTIRNCIIESNRAYYGGGICCLNSTNTRIYNCIFENNHAYAGGRRGGGLACLDASHITLANCTFTGNQAAYGGGLFAENSIPIVRNTIIWNNDALVEGDSVYVSEDTTNIQYCNIEVDSGVFPGTGNINADPEWVSGPSGAYYLSQVAAGQASDSPCVNAGYTSAAAVCYPPDFVVCMSHLTTRTDHQTDTGTADMGYHYDPAAPVPTATPTISPTPTATSTPPAAVRHVPSEYPNIQSALNASWTDDIILVADGTYTGRNNRDLDFEGKAIMIASENGPLNCIIDLQQSGRAFLFQNGETSQSIVNGFTIKNGSGTEGGAIYCYQASPRIQECIFTQNASDLGGAIYVSDGSPSIRNCLFYTNAAITGNERGGAVYLASNADAVIELCTITQNSARSGGGLYIGSASPVLLHSIIWDNSASVTGPEIHVSGGSPSITWCDVKMPSGTWPGDGNINSDPLFVSAFGANYYLCQTAAGQAADSPCVNAGMMAARDIMYPGPYGIIKLSHRVTRTDQVTDTGMVDLGFHFPVISMTPSPTRTPTVTPTPSWTPLPTRTPAPTRTRTPTPTPATPTATPRPATCPYGSLVSQPMEPRADNFYGYASDPDYNTTDRTVVYDYYETDEPLCIIRWWGFHSDFHETGFTITVYEDVAGSPGTILDIRTVNATAMLTDYDYYSKPIYRFLYDLSPCIEVIAGWLSIEGYDGGDQNVFHWLSSADGDGMFWYDIEGERMQIQNNASFCLIGPPATPTPAPPTHTPTPLLPTITPTPECVHHGDVDFNGFLTAGDAQLAFNIALGFYLPTYEEECAADCNADGVVTAGDAQMIFYAALGFIPGCEDPL